jgi:hypothetical protein
MLCANNPVSGRGASARPDQCRVPVPTARGSRSGACMLCNVLGAGTVFCARVAPGVTLRSRCGRLGPFIAAFWRWLSGCNVGGDVRQTASTVLKAVISQLCTSSLATENCNVPPDLSRHFHRRLDAVSDGVRIVIDDQCHRSVVYRPMLAACNGGTARGRRVWGDGRADDHGQPRVPVGRQE